MNNKEFIHEVYQLVVGDEHASRTDETKPSYEEVLSLINDYQQSHYDQDESLATTNKVKTRTEDRGLEL